ncbi:MAG: pseudouridine synthase [Chitinophagaceae bacterium]|nr:pseudouridine synthase [Chitinophagaceae bacterium]
MQAENGIQINKYISSSGYCSRREADVLVAQGRVMINDNLALPESRVLAQDKVYVDDELLKQKKTDFVYLILNKPKGITTTTDLQDKSNVIRFLNYPKRIFPVGRLDKDSDGLLLLTDDGDIVNKILRAGNAHEKEYVVTVNKPVTPDFIVRMSKGLPILGTTTLPCKVKKEGSRKFSITLIQGLNRQIRRMCQYLGYDVVTLTRVRLMNLHLDQLPPGKWRTLHKKEVETLHNMLKDSTKTN